MSSAPRGPPDAAAMKARIVSHMNADHQLSLRLYLAHYNHVPLGSTHEAKLEDITTEHMILTSQIGRHIVPLEPAMPSLMAARERLVAMHQDCLAALDLSDTVIDRYQAPDRALSWVLIPLCLLILATFPFRDSLRPESGSVAARIWSLGGAVPGLARLAHAVAPWILAFVVLAHGVEAAWFAATKLRRHWVEPGSAVWWLWVLDCAIEGYPAWLRFNRCVTAKEGAAKKAGDRH